jgi:hypothetical protein
VDEVFARTWRVDHLRDTFFASTFAKQDAGGRCMSQYVTTNGLASIGACEQSAGAGIRLDLVDDQDRNVEFLRHLTEFAQMLAELALTFIQFSTAMEVIAEVCHDAVDDEKTILPS